MLISVPLATSGIRQAQAKREQRRAAAMTTTTTPTAAAAAAPAAAATPNNSLSTVSIHRVGQDVVVEARSDGRDRAVSPASPSPRSG